MPRLPRIFVLLSILIPLAARADAQPTQPPPQQQPAGTPVENTISESREATNDQKDWHFIGKVEIELGGDTKIYADDVRLSTTDDHAVATGNVVFAQGNNRISAERADFNTKTHLGTFYNASGIANVPPQRQTARPGAVAPPTMPGQETIVYFFGDKVEKLGPKKYKITKGGFSTCVQPTSRWDLHADTVILNIDHYTLLTQAVLRVKGVPMFYLPVLYYPTKKDGRATGFLLPTYGSSTLQGQSFHNAFFWAIDRSEDATILHDWFSKTGQGVGGEYRYNFGNGTDGNIRTYLRDQHEATYAQDNGNDPLTVAASRSYEIRGGASQLLPGNLHARARIDYFSSIVSSQTFNTNIYDSSRNQRSFGGNVVGAWAGYALNATLDHSEYFYDTTNSVLSGSWPRVAINRNERPLLADSPVYFSVGTEFVRELRETHTVDTSVVGLRTDVSVDTGLSRLDVIPQIRYPFKKWQWFTVNSTVSWRDTYYTRSLNPTGDVNVAPSVINDEGLNRTFVTLQSQILGPVFNRVWDTPDNGYAEKFKHSVEPFVNIQYTSPVDNFAQIVQFDGFDQFVGGTQYTYGLNNRFYAKRKSATPGAPAQSREILSVELTQTYYTNQLASQLDRQYQTNSISGSTDSVPSSFSPVALSVRGQPTNEINATVRAEFDSRYHSLRTISANGTYSWNNRVQTTVGWSKRGLIPQLAGFNDPTYLDQSINASTNVHTKDNQFGGLYTFNYDVLHSSVLQQRMTGFYNAQCCGLAFEYQTYNFSAFSSSPVAADHRFFLSFTLAGLGNFSPFSGAMSGVPR